MVTSMHTVYEEVLHLGVIRHFPINNSLLLSIQSSGTKHKNDLEQKDKEFEDSADSQKPKQLDKELSIIKSKKGAILGLIKRLDADADKFVSKAGITDDVVEMQKLLTKANSFEQSVKKKNDNS